MKNVISFYYELYPLDIHQSIDKYTFKIDNNYYAFVLYKRKLELINNLYSISKELLKKGIYTHEIIPNKENKIITFVNNEPYVLLKLYDEMKEKVKIEDIITFSNLTTNIFKEQDDWGLLWSNKIDYYEYQVNQFGKKYPIIRESFSYFVGLAENGISLYNELKNNITYTSIAHLRMTPNSTYFDLYNPLEFIVDYRCRDVSEYLKFKFLKEDIFEDIVEYITNNNLTETEIKLFFIRMLFATFYFDKYDKIIMGKMKEEELMNIIKKVDNYESTLKKFYSYLSYYIKMPDIGWLKPY